MGYIDILNSRSAEADSKVPSGMSTGIVRMGSDGSRKVDFDALYDSNKRMCGLIYDDGQTGEPQDETEIKGEKWDTYKYIVTSALGILMDPIGGTASVLVDCIGDVLGMASEQKQVNAVESQRTNGPQDSLPPALARSLPEQQGQADRPQAEQTRPGGMSRGRVIAPKAEFAQLYDKAASRGHVMPNGKPMSLTMDPKLVGHKPVSLSPKAQQNVQGGSVPLSPKAQGFNRTGKGMVAEDTQSQSQGNSL